MGRFFHCNTGTFTKNKLSLPCFVSGSNNYEILKACNRNLTGKATPVYLEKINLEVTVGLKFCCSEFDHINRAYYKFCISLLGLSLQALGNI